MKNNISYDNGSEVVLDVLTNVSHNSWDSPVTVSDGDFASVSPVGADGPRQANGALPALDFLHLAAGSDLIDAGIDVGLPCSGGGCDLGAFEF
jgi:hypothetical protein